MPWTPESRESKCKLPQLGIIWIVFEGTEATRITRGLDKHMSLKGQWNGKEAEKYIDASGPPTLEVHLGS